MKTHRPILVGLVSCASRLGIPPAWLKEKALTGDVPCLHVGKRRLLFNVASVEAALVRLASGERATTDAQQKGETYAHCAHE
jgi:hypothetical protein